MWAVRAVWMVAWLEGSLWLMALMAVLRGGGRVRRRAGGSRRDGGGIRHPTLRGVGRVGPVGAAVELRGAGGGDNDSASTAWPDAAAAFAAGLITFTIIGNLTLCKP